MADKFTYKQVKKEKNKLQYEVKTSKELFNEIYEEIYRKEAKGVKVAGFRPGMAPRAEIERKIASNVLNNTINKLLPDVTYEILLKEDLNPISGIKYDLKKINEDSSIDYEFTVINTPEINVEELSKIKVDSRIEDVKNEEIDMVIRNIIQSTLKEEDWKTEPKEGEEQKQDFEITDEMVSKLGYEDEKTYEGLKIKVKETLERVKKEQSENEYAAKVLEKAVKIVDFIVPEDLVEDEVNHREHHFVERVQNLKLDVETYLKTQNKTLESLREEWRNEIKSNAAVDILTINLAKQEKLIPTEEELEEEIEKIEDQVTKIKYKTDESLRDHMRTVMARNKGVKRIVDLTKENK